MKIGRQDIKLLAIIGAAGAAGLVATGMIIDAAESPHEGYRTVHVQTVKEDRERTQVQVIRQAPWPGPTSG